MFVQVIPLVLSMSIQQKPLVLVIFAQINLFLETMFVSKPICGNNVCENKPTNVNILPCKPFLTDQIYHVNSSLSSQQLFFIFFPSFLIFSV